MTYIDVSIDQSLGEVFPFDQLSPPVLKALAADSQRLRYRIGQPILRRESMPHQIVVIVEGHARLLGYDATKRAPVTLERLGPKSILGLAGMTRGVACESAIASSEIEAITIPAGTVRQLIATNEAFARAVTGYCYLAEVFDLLSQYFQAQARSVSDLAKTAKGLQEQAIARTLRAGPVTLGDSSPYYLWFVSSQSIVKHPAGSWLLPEMLDGRIVGEKNTRLIGLDMRQLANLSVPDRVQPDYAFDSTVVTTSAENVSAESVDETSSGNGSSAKQQRSSCYSRS